jgi:hypothetical protein
VGFGLFGRLGCSRKGITRDVGKGVKCVPEMVRFWNPHLFLTRGLSQAPQSLHFHLSLYLYSAQLGFGFYSHLL